MGNTEEWQPPKHIKPWMVCAACRHKLTNHIICGARHWDKIMTSQMIYRHEEEDPWEQGFIDQFGRFYNRKEAMKAVLENGQPFSLKRNGGSGEELFSEGLY